MFSRAWAETGRVRFNLQCLLSQGRDDNLHFWDVESIFQTLSTSSSRLNMSDEDGDDARTERVDFSGRMTLPQDEAPHLIWTLPISSLNFCKFDVCVSGMHPTNQFMLIGLTVTNNSLLWSLRS
jgi:hypothetical protein